jgi:hypothetical protein
MNWEQDQKWGELFIPEAQAILGQALVIKAPKREDMYHNTDLMVLFDGSARFALRVRRPQYYAQYKGQITIRSSRPKSENKTELAKILEGWGDYFFYGIAAESGNDLRCWVIGDLDVFRRWWPREERRLGHAPGLECHNGDGSSDFRAFKLNYSVTGDEVPAAFIMARQYMPGMRGIGVGSKLDRK